MIGALVGAVVGAGVSAWGASKGGKASAKAAEDAAESAQLMAQQEYAMKSHYTELASKAIDLAQDRTAAAEEARAYAMYGLGRPGTYEQDYASWYAQNDPYNTSFVNKRGVTKPGKTGFLKKTSATVSTPGGPMGTMTDEVQDYKLGKGFQKGLESSRSYRLASYMTAQADELVRGTGELYEKIKESVIGPIMEGAGMAHQQLMQQIQTMAAKGGSARNRAVQAATMLAGSQDIMRDRMNSLWQANLSIIEFGINNARSQLSWNDSWINNRAGIRDDFNTMMNNFTAMRVDSILPQQIAAASGLADSSMIGIGLQLEADQIRADTTKNIYQIIGGAISTVGGVMGKGGGWTTLAGAGGGGGGGYSPSGSVGPPAGSGGGWNTGITGGVGGSSNYLSSSWDRR
jgi:hypothetical protein